MASSNRRLHRLFCLQLCLASAQGQETVCVDNYDSCNAWANEWSPSECETNPGYMNSNCAVSCGTCATLNPCWAGPEPCQNGGTCTKDESDAQGYTCACPSGFLGHDCDVVNDPCDPNPCQNAGTCDDGVCDCTGTSFTGATCAALTNVALNMPATQSSTHGPYEAHLAVDGNRAPYVPYCAHTEINHDSNPWWRVDLEGLFEVHAVVITNRGDCCGNLLANFDILVSRHLTDPSQRWPDTSALCLHRGPQIADGATERLNCSQPTAGRYVTLLISQTSGPLHFCELEVLGVPALLVSRTGVYKNHRDQKATGDVIKEIYVRSVIVCASSCTEEPGCTAFNLQSKRTAGSGREQRRVCQLLAYGGVNHPASLGSLNGWNFHLMEAVARKTVIIM